MPFMERHGWATTFRRVWPIHQPNTMKVHYQPQHQPYPTINHQLPPDPGPTVGESRPWPYGGHAGQD